LINKKEF